MGTIDGKTDNTRSEEEGCDRYTYSRRSRDARFQSAEFGNKQERIDRAYGTESNFLRPSTATTGGILSQLIDEFRDQVAVKKSEIEYLEAKIHQFQEILEESEQQKQNNN